MAWLLFENRVYRYSRAAYISFSACVGVATINSKWHTLSQIRPRPGRGNCVTSRKKLLYTYKTCLPQAMFRLMSYYYDNLEAGKKNILL